MVFREEPSLADFPDVLCALIFLEVRQDAVGRWMKDGRMGEPLGQRAPVTSMAVVLTAVCGERK